MKPAKAILLATALITCCGFDRIEDRRQHDSSQPSLRTDRTGTFGDPEYAARQQQLRNPLARDAGLHDLPRPRESLGTMPPVVPNLR